MSRKQILLIPLLLLFAGSSGAQSPIDSIQNANAGIKIAVAEISGKWLSVEYPGVEVVFVEKENELLRFPQNYVHPFSFNKENDSITVKGVAMNWPPYTCIVKLLDNGTLETYTYTYHSESFYKQTFRRE